MDDVAVALVLATKLQDCVDTVRDPVTGIERGVMSAAGVEMIRAFGRSVRRETLEETVQICQSVHDKRKNEGGHSNEEWKAMVNVCLGALYCRIAIRSLLYAPATEADPAEPGHASDCAIYNGPAYPPGPCNCGFVKPDPAVALATMLRECAAQFEFYAEQHLAKSPPDVAKAGTNREFADRCRAALALAGRG